MPKGEVMDAEKYPISLEISLANPVSIVDEGFKLSCRIINSTEHTIKLEPFLYMNVSVHIVALDGKADYQTDIMTFVSEIVTEQSIMVMPPQKDRAFNWYISRKLYPDQYPRRPGKYRLYLVYTNKSESLYGAPSKRLWVGELRSNTIEFEVK
jgi:hypothetical protein